MAKTKLEVVLVGDEKDAKRAIASTEKALGALDDATSRSSGHFSGLRDKIATVGKIGGAALAGVVVAAGALTGVGIKVAGNMEQAQIGFTTLLGSAEKADAFIKDMKGFAARTPFEFAGLQESASKLVAVGIEANRVIPLMTVLGDATSAVGTGAEGIDRAVVALTQMQQKGKVTGEEMLQLVEAGIPAWDALAAKLGTDVPHAQDRVSKGQVKVNDLFVALETSAGPALQRVKGMMDKQADSLQGLWSTMKDNFSMGLADAFQSQIPALKRVMVTIGGTITEGMGVFAQTITQVGPTIALFGERLVETFSSLVPHLGPVVQSLVGLGASVLGSALPAFQRLAPILATVATILSDKLNGALDTLGPMWERMVDALGPNLPKIAQAVGDLAGASANLAVASAPLLTAFVQLKTDILLALVGHLTDLIGVLTPLTGVVASNEGAMRGLVGAYLAFKGVAIGAESIKTFQDLARAAEGAQTAMAAAQLGSKWETVRLAVLYAIPAVVSYAAAWWSAAAGVIGATWPVLLAVAAIAALTAAVLYAYNNWQPFHDAVDAVGRKIAEVWQDYLVPFGGWLTGTLVPAVIATAKAVMDFASHWSEVPSKIGGALAALPGVVAAGFGVVLTWLSGFGSRIAQTVAGWTSAFLAWIPGALAELPGKLAYLAGYVLGWLAGTAIKLQVGVWLLAWSFLTWTAGVLAELPGRLAAIAGAVWGWVTATAATLGEQLVAWALQFALWAAGVAAGIGVWLSATAASMWAWIAATAAALPGNLYGWTMQFFSWVASVAAAIAGWLGSVAGQFWGWVGEVRDDLPGHLIGWSVAFASWVMSVAGAIPGWFGSVYSAISGAIAAIPGAITGALGSVVDVGRSIVDGLWRGIQDRAGWIIDRARDFVGGIVSGMKDALGAHSPARKLIPVGESIGQGLALGIARAEGLVTKAYESMVSPLAGSLESSMTLNTTGGALSGAISNMTGSAAQTAAYSVPVPAASPAAGAVPPVTFIVQAGAIVHSERDLGRYLAGVVQAHLDSGGRWPVPPR